MSQIFAPIVSAPIALPDALAAIDRAESSAARAQAAADALHAFGFDRVVISLRDPSLNPTCIATAGASDPNGLAAGIAALPGAVWRRRLAQVERYRKDDLYLLDGTDAWVAREFFGAEAVRRRDPRYWVATDLIVALLHGAEGELLGIVKLADAHDGLRPDEAKRRDIGAIMRHLAARLAYDTFRDLARRRAARLQRLQEAGAALARSLDEHEIVRELGRQAMRATGADGVTIVSPNLDDDILTTWLMHIRGAERARGPVRLGDGLIAEAARTGRAVRVGDREADKARERAGLPVPLSLYDVVGDAGSAASVLAVPMLVGIQLVGVLAVHAVATEAFGAEDEEVLATMASQAATAIANARRYAESERERRQTEALADVARAVGESLRLGEVLRLILRHAVALLGAEGACIALRQDDYLHIVAAVGGADVLAGVHLPVAGSLLGRAVVSNELVLSNDLRADSGSSRTVQRLATIDRAVISPLITARGTIGAIGVINRDADFTPDDGRVLQRLADHVAVAIVNARLFEEVERATREWKIAFDSIASGMIVVEETGVVRRCNARAAELCSRTIPEMLNKPLREVLMGTGPLEGDSVESLVGRAIAENGAVRETLRDDTRGRLYEMYAAPHPDGGCVLSFDDVTSVHRLAERHRRVLETVSDAIVITGLDGFITFANPAAHTLFLRDTLVGVHVASLVAPDFLEEVLRYEREARAGEHQRYECRVARANGEQRLVAVSTAPQFELGQVTGTVACLRDVSDQRAGAAALADSEARLAHLLEAASDAIFTVDREGRFTSVNRGLIEESGRTREELIGAMCTVVLDPRDHGVVDQLITATLAGARVRQELHYLGKNGQARVGLLTADALIENGQVVGALGIMRDTTDDTIQREATAQQQRLAAAGALLGGIANEINNPLGSLLAIAELEASSPTLGVHERDVLERIREEARRASRIVSQLLESTSDRPVERAALDVNRVVRAALDLQGWGLRQRGISTTMTLADTPLLVQGDSRQLQLTIVNLLANAEQAIVTAGCSGELHVETRGDGDFVSISLQDNGNGIAPADAPRLFEPHFTTRPGRGSRGLGLTIARSIVLAHGGSIQVDPSVERGARFRITLPRVASTGNEAPAASASDARARTLLLVEDEPALRSAMDRYLRGRGYQVVLASNGADALTTIPGREIDLVLLDLRMQGMSGEETYRRMCERHPELAERVLFITGDLHSPTASEFVRESGRPVLPKPFTLADLERRIAELV